MLARSFPGESSPPAGHGEVVVPQPIWIVGPSNLQTHSAPSLRRIGFPRHGNLSGLPSDSGPTPAFDSARSRAAPTIDCNAAIAANSRRWRAGIRAQESTGEGVAFNRDGDVALVGSVFHDAPGRRDILLACHDVAGRHRWTRAFGGEGEDVGRSVAFDRAGNLFVAGSFEGRASFGSGPGNTDRLVAKGGSDAFVAKFDAAGTPLWARRFGGPGYDVAHDLAVDPDGFVYVTGSFSSTAETEPSQAALILTSRGSDDAFILRLDTKGTPVWLRQVGGAGADAGVGVVVADGVLIACGRHQGPGVRAGPFSLPDSGASDAFAIAYRTLDGGEVQVVSFGGPGEDSASDIVVTSLGEAFVTGICSGQPGFELQPAATATAGLRRQPPDENRIGRSLTQKDASMSKDSSPEAFVLKLDSALAPEWMVSIGSPYGGAASHAMTEARGIAVDDSGCHLYVVGRLIRSGVLDPTGRGAGDTDEGEGSRLEERGFLWAVGRDGLHSWFEVPDGEGSCWANAVAVRGLNQLAYAGTSVGPDSSGNLRRRNLFLRSK
jgi:hypothetical protein